MADTAAGPGVRAPQPYDTIDSPVRQAAGMPEAVADAKQAGCACACGAAQASAAGAICREARFPNREARFPKTDIGTIIMTPGSIKDTL